jgi:hypothetical protein
VAALALPSGAVSADDGVFTVANYPVEARAENAVAAKERALLDGQQAAFRSLLKRLVPVTAYARLASLNALKAGDLVEGLSVRSERNSSTEYLANLDFTFNAQAVRELLRREGIPFSDAQAPQLILVPLWRRRAAQPAESEAGWTNAWAGLDLEHTVTPIKLERLKAGVKPDVVGALAAGDGTALRGLAGSFGSELVVVALAELEADKQRLFVTLAGRDAVGAFSLRRAYRIDPADPSYTNELAAVIGLGILEGRWKAIRAGSGSSVAASAPGGELAIAVAFRGMGEWQDISRKLAATPGVEQLEVAGLSARSARVTLRYAPGGEELAGQLARQGLVLRNSQGTWTLAAQ